MSALRHDTIDENGNIVYGLRLWEADEFEPRESDVFTELSINDKGVGISSKEIKNVFKRSLLLSQF